MDGVVPVNLCHNLVRRPAWLTCSRARTSDTRVEINRSNETFLRNGSPVIMVKDDKFTSEKYAERQDKGFMDVNTQLDISFTDQSTTQVT